MKSGFLYIAVWACCSAISFQESSAVDNNEYEVKAAFIYNFTKYIEWETESLNESSTFRISIYKNSQIESFLRDILKNKKINSKKVEIKQVSTFDNLETSHIVFIPQSVSLKDFKQCTGHSMAKNTLIISEKPQFLGSGSCINFLLVNNKIKFEISLSNMKKNKIKASSQLLKLAERIIE